MPFEIVAACDGRPFSFYGNIRIDFTSYFGEKIFSVKNLSIVTRLHAVINAFLDHSDIEPWK